MSRLVSLSYLNDYNLKNLEESIKDAVASLEIANRVKPEMKVLIKANLPIGVSKDMAETTHPAVICALANWLTEMGAKCIVADSPYKKYTPEFLEKVYLNTGILDTANKTNCELNRNMATFTCETPDGVMAKSLTLLEVINDVDAIINVGKLKIDSSLGYMGAVSNLFGFVPGEVKTQVLNRLNTQKDFHNYCIDIYNVVKDKIIFNVIDGIVTKESGDMPRLLYCLGVAENMFSLDACIIDILGIGYKNTVLKQAKQRELFDFEKGYKTTKERIEKFQLPDYALHEFCDASSLNKKLGNKKRYFKSHQRRPIVEVPKCKGCGVCSKICPTGAIVMRTDKNGELYAHIDYAKCIFCFKCHTACPYSVIDVVVPSGHKKIMKEIDKQNEKV